VPVRDTQTRTQTDRQTDRQTDSQTNSAENKGPSALQSGQQADLILLRYSVGKNRPHLSTYAVLRCGLIMAHLPFMMMMLQRRNVDNVTTAAIVVLLVLLLLSLGSDGDAI